MASAYLKLSSLSLVKGLLAVSSGKIPPVMSSSHNQVVWGFPRITIISEVKYHDRCIPSHPVSSIVFC